MSGQFCDKQFCTHDRTFKESLYSTYPCLKEINQDTLYNCDDNGKRRWIIARKGFSHGSYQEIPGEEQAEQFHSSLAPYAHFEQLNPPPPKKNTHKNNPNKLN